MRKNNNFGSKKNKSKKFRSTTNMGPKESPWSTIVFTGPLKPPRGELLQQRTVTLFLRAITQLTSDGAGGITTVLSNSPVSTGNWSALATTWDEYRVDGFTVQFTPYEKYNRGTIISVQPVYTVVDHNSAATLTSESQATQYESIESKSLDRVHRTEARRSEVAESQYITTATPVAQYFVKYIGTGLSSSVVYGDLLITYRVQFRGRGI
jgi:hypothetical protein